MHKWTGAAACVLPGVWAAAPSPATEGMCTVELTPAP